MRKVLTALVQATILFLSISASAQPAPDAQAILKKVNETYLNLKSYQFNYKTVSDSKTERDGLTSTMRDESLSRITVVRPDRIRVETQDSHSSVVFISDGKTVWLYSSQLNAYTKRASGKVDIFAGENRTDSRYERMARLVNTKLADYARLTAEPRNLTLLPDETLTVEGRQIPCYVLSLVRGVGGNKDNTRYWIDRERYLVLRESTEQTFPISPDSVMRSLNLVNFMSAAINEPVADSAFSYTPPKGAIEIDRLDTESLARKRNAPVNRVGQNASVNRIGRAAPNFTLTDLNGATVSLQSLRGKAVLLNFWASWCGPCRVEMPHLEKLHREYKNKGVIILGIDDEEAEVAQNYLKRNGYTFNSLIDAERQVSRLYRISAIPQSFFITKDGKIAASLTGSRRESELRDGIEKALAWKIEEAGVQAESELETAALPAPKLFLPKHLSHFDHFPRTTVLVWDAVPGAAGYRVETDYQYNGKWAGEDRGWAYAVEVTAPTYTFDFVGAQPGRWRVWAFDARGREGAKSEWREFVYSR